MIGKPVARCWAKCFTPFDWLFKRFLTESYLDSRQCNLHEGLSDVHFQASRRPRKSASRHDHASSTFIRATIRESLADSPCGSIYCGCQRHRLDRHLWTHEPSLLACSFKDKTSITGLSPAVAVWRPLCDILLEVPSTATPRIQETHICIYHFICQRVEEICAQK